MTNSGGPLALSVTNKAVLGGVTNSVTGTILWPKASALFDYDADGNLTKDSLWNYAWDERNRLSSVHSSTNLPTTARKQIRFTYDYQGRRIGKQVFNWGSTNYSTNATTTVKYIWDGWLLLAEVNASNTLQRSYGWGLDLANSLEKAGGIGGWLVVTHHGSGTTNAYPAYDGNGNIMALVNASNGSLLAKYEYGPFAEMVRSSGPWADANSFTFSTKQLDTETGLLYYGYRYYSPTLGRWISRDPIEEGDGNNMYAFVRNGAAFAIDIDGRETLFGMNVSAGMMSTITAGVIGGYVGALGQGILANAAGESFWEGAVTGFQIGAIGGLSGGAVLAIGITGPTGSSALAAC